MAAEAQRKVQNAVETMVNDLDKSHLRDVQRRMHLCAADCCTDKTSSMESVQNCMQNCQNGLSAAQQVMEREMNDFQERLTRCAQTCQDKLKLKVSPDSKDKDISKYQKEMDVCVLKCADEHVVQLPKIEKSIIAALSRLK